MARAIVHQMINEKDPLDGLALITKGVPAYAEPGKVVVYLNLRPINPIDILEVRMGWSAAKLPVVAGKEGFGIVFSVGKGVTRVKPGERVVPFLWKSFLEGQGSWQQYVSVTEDLLWPVPDSVSDEAASQFIINPWAAYGILQDSQIPQGEYILQTAAGSALGRVVIQLAKHWGIKTINIVRRSEQKAELKALGADEVISSTDEDVVTRVKEVTDNKLAYGAIDAVGGELTSTVCQCVRDGGSVLIYGALTGITASVSIPDLMTRGIVVKGWSLSSHFDDPKRRQGFIDGISELLESGALHIPGGSMFDLADFRKAIEQSEKVGRGSKVFLTSY